MDKEQKAIVQMLNSYHNSWETMKGLRALLADCIPEKKMLRNVMCYAYEAGIVQSYGQESDIQKLKYRYIKILKNEYAVVEEYADWAIQTWIYVLSQKNENKAGNCMGNDMQFYIDEKKLKMMKLALLTGVRDLDNNIHSHREVVTEFMKMMERIACEYD